MELTLIENTAHRPTIHLDFKHPCSPVTHPHMAASQRGLGKKDGGKNGKTLYLRNYFHSSLGHKLTYIQPYLKVFRALRICSRQTPEEAQTEEKHYCKALSICHASFKSIPKPGIYLPCHTHLHLALPNSGKPFQITLLFMSSPSHSHFIFL